MHAVTLHLIEASEALRIWCICECDSLSLSNITTIGILHVANYL